MPKAKETNKDEVKKAIADHLALHGPTGWPDVMAKFPEVSRATFFRYIKEVREEIERNAAERPGADLKLVQKRIRSRVNTPDQTQRQLKANLPVAPSPAMIQGFGAEIDEVFDFMGNLKALMRDADMMRSAAVRTDAEGAEQLKNPNLMDRSIARKLGLLETWLRSQDLVWNYDRMQELHAIIIDEVGRAAPDVQQAIVARIRALNNRRGLTIDARIS